MRRLRRGGGAWWREAIIYHIYPRSFQDSDGDGSGDLPGIVERLDYLNDGSDRSLGIDAIWLSPIYPSPQADWGYDVSDYTAVDPVFGDLAAFDRLVAACHARGVRVILDFVPNHSSEAHPWFEASRSGRDDPQRDWYIWRDPAAGGGPPNNWRSVFGGPAWTHDAASGQYYLHSYLASQPDLNWRNPEVVAALSGAMRFWLGRGVDGFRLDAMARLLKHPELPDNPPGRELHNYLQPELAGAARALRAVIDEYPERVAIGEVWAPAEVRSLLYGPPDLDGLHLVFDFELIRRGPAQDAAYVPWEAPRLAEGLRETRAGLPAGALPSYALGNHDVSRLASRLANQLGAGGEGARARTRAAALLQLALPGPPTLYYGEEIGMLDAAIPPSRALDPVGRDPERTPMQWDRSPGRGFSSGEPWLPFGPRDVDVASQDGDERSLLNLYRRAIWTRKATPALRRGALAEVAASDGVLTFERRIEGSPPILVAVSTAAERRAVPLRDAATLLLASDEDVERRDGALSLPPWGAAWLSTRA